MELELISPKLKIDGKTYHLGVDFSLEYAVEDNRQVCVESFYSHIEHTKKEVLEKINAYKKKEIFHEP